MAIDLTRPHHTDRTTARHRVEALARTLAEELSVDYAWEGDRLTFQRLGAKGTIEVNDTHVHVHVARSPFLPVSEAWLRTEIEQYLVEHLPASPEDASPTDTAPPTNHSSEPAKTGAPDRSLLGRLTDLAGTVTGTALRMTTEAPTLPLKMVGALLIPADQLAGLPSDQRQRLQEAGSTLRGLREQAGYALADLAASLDLDAPDVLDAIEAGRARPSFHLLLGLAAHLAFDDPIPFLVRMTRAYHPEVWAVLEDWDIGPIATTPRARAFADVYHQHPEAATLSDDAFADVLRFTQEAFALALRHASRSGPR